MPIFKQLQLEEALLRADTQNYCIVNYGSPRAIVMGISGNPQSLINVETVRNDDIPVYQRFSGGGTVIVDEKTLFVTFIFSKGTVDTPAFPEPILRWAADFYASAWGIPDFRLRENDFAIGDLKCGGNAQYIKKERWLHHTSFLWDYSSENMRYLLMPEKRPKYRQDRSHDEFLCRLKEHASPEDLIQKIQLELAKRFTIEEFDISQWTPESHRTSTRQLTHL